MVSITIPTKVGKQIVFITVETPKPNALENAKLTLVGESKPYVETARDPFTNYVQPKKTYVESARKPFTNYVSPTAYVETERKPFTNYVKPTTSPASTIPRTYNTGYKPPFRNIRGGFGFL